MPDNNHILEKETEAASSPVRARAAQDDNLEVSRHLETKIRGSENIDMTEKLLDLRGRAKKQNDEAEDAAHRREQEAADNKHRREMEILQKNFDYVKQKSEQELEKARLKEEIVDKSHSRIMGSLRELGGLVGRCLGAIVGVYFVYKGDLNHGVPFLAASFGISVIPEIVKLFRKERKDNSKKDDGNGK